jgi:small subunit ribosomal protein S17e
MGRIKTDMVKRTTRKLVEVYPDKFSKSFEANKKALAETAEVRSKKLRNVIAGYASRLKVQSEEGGFRVRKRKFDTKTKDDDFNSY